MSDFETPPFDQLSPDWASLFEDFPFLPDCAMVEEVSSEYESERSSEVSEHFGAIRDKPRRMYLSIEDGTHH